MKIEVGKFYRIRAGRKARIYAIDCGGHWPIHGAVLYDGFWEACEWLNNGERFNCIDSELSLISEWTEPLDFDPSCLPAWAEWIAMNEGGDWFWFQKEPTVTLSIDEEWAWMPIEAGMRGGIHHKYVPKDYTGDWKYSLHKVSDLKTNKS